MSTEIAPAPAPTSAPSEDELRAWARRHIERTRKLKRDIAAFAIGMVALTAIWATVEWQDHGALRRLSDNGNPGDWQPWIVYVALIWGFLLALDVLRVRFDRPAGEAEIERELQRQRAR